MTLSSSNPAKQLLKTIFACFFISGMAGLIYEILWIRMLGLIFGHTVYAITAVLVVFMGGLALGSYMCSRIIDRVQNLLKLYGLFEIGIGFYCLCIPWMMELIKRAYLQLAGSLDLSYASFTMTQFFLVSLVLLFPTTLMGATLPILSRFFVKDLATVGQRVGTLYALNTFGAVLGTYLAGFELLPALGMRLTLFVAATLNIGIGVLILLFDRRLRQHFITENTVPMTQQTVSEVPKPFALPWSFKSWLLVGGFAFSGAASMIYEVSWTRALSLIIGSSTYAFSTMLLSFLVGIAAGSAFFARITKKYSISPDWFVGLQLIIGLSAAMVYPFFDRLPELFLTAFRISHSYSFILFIQTVISFAAMFLPTFFIGATFPCVVQILSRGLHHVGLDIGRIYAFNTIGAIIGSFASGVILIPMIGIQSSIKLAIAINLLVGLGLFLIYFQKTVLRMAMSVGMAVFIVVVMLMPTWNQKVMSSGVAVYGPEYLGSSVSGSYQSSLKNEKILFYKEGISSTVTVHQSKETTYLRVNGKTDASNGSDMHTQLMLGHIPALLHPDPKKALVIGLGSGITVGALLQYPLNQIDVVEIEPAIIEASSFFKKENRDALADPRVKLNIADGRNFLFMTPKHYDLIVSEPSNPWIGGVSTLFTVEFFDLVRQHLNPNGIMTQWFHGYSMTPEDVQMVVASFRTVFPYATLWMTSQSDYLLVGTLGPLAVDLNRLMNSFEKNPLFRQDMERMKIASPVAVLSDFFLDDKDLSRLTDGADLNTDDRLALEFSSPRSLYENTVSINVLALQRIKKSRYPPFKEGDRLEILKQPEAEYQLALGFINKEMPKEGMEHLQEVLAKDPRHIPALLESGKIKMRFNHLDEAAADFETVLQLNPKSVEGNHQLGLLYLKRHKPDNAIVYLSHAVSYDPDESLYHLALATAYRESKLYKEAVIQYRLALDRNPQDQRTMGALGATLIQLEQPVDAVDVLDKAIAIDPQDYRLRFQIGQAYLLLKQNHEAREAFETAIALNPQDADPYVGLGKVWLAQGDRKKAISYFKKATDINPRMVVPEV